MTQRIDDQPLLVLGASGYIGGRLVPLLLDQGYRVRAAGRSQAKLAERFPSLADGLELCAVDVLNPEALQSAVQGCRVIYYLVHSMNPQSGDFAETDRKAAANVAAAAAKADVECIIYLSGLGDPADTLSEHLSSRAEVAEILRRGRVPVTVLRAAMIIGSGSASFEILRYLVEGLPLMITPRWLDTPCQPIAVSDVLHYLKSCIESPETIGEDLDIGCEEVVTYRQLMDIYAEEARLRPRLIVRVPVLTPKLSSYWIQLVTPIPAVLARPLAEGLRNPVLVRDARIRQIVAHETIDAREAIRLALDERLRLPLRPSWEAEGNFSPGMRQPGDPPWAGGIAFREGLEIEMTGTVERVWDTLAGIGGDNGWLYANLLWRLRGWLDELCGGPGLRRGRPAGPLQAGMPLDFWRVNSCKEQESLFLEAEMKLPGRAGLAFQIKPVGPSRIVLRQESVFLPRGLWGRLYWYLLLPVHRIIFSGMLRGIGRRAGGQIVRGPEPIPSGEKQT